MIQEYRNKNNKQTGMKLNLLPPEPRWKWTDMFNLKSSGADIVEDYRTDLKRNEHLNVRQPTMPIPKSSGMTLNLLPETKSSIAEIFFNHTLPGKLLTSLMRFFESMGNKGSETSESVDGDTRMQTSGMKLNLLPKNRRS